MRGTFETLKEVQEVEDIINYMTVSEYFRCKTCNKSDLHLQHKIKLYTKLIAEDSTFKQRQQALQQLTLQMI